jgi:AcrR family transcriptional regulator
MEEAEGNPAQRLPPGPHGIPAELVARNQRERLISAMAEACAERGYTGASVSDVVKRAGVSSVTFYRLFEDKRDCMLAAHRQLLGRLLEEVDRACETERGRAEKVRAAIRTALSLFAADPPAAQLLTVDIMVLGPAGVARHDAAIEALASRLRGGRDPREDPSLPNADWALVASMSMLVGKRVSAGEADRLAELEDEFVAMAGG